MQVKADIDLTTNCGLAPGIARYIEYRVGDDTPLVRRQQGIFYENAYQAYFWTYKNPGVRIKMNVPPGGELVDDMESLLEGVGWPIITKPSLSDVVPKLEEKWKNSEFYAGVSIGEGRESVQMITGRLDSIRKAAIALWKRNLGDALRELAKVPRNSRKRASFLLDKGDISGSWLELVYGWLPLYRDIHAASELIRLEPRNGVIRASHKNTGDVIFSQYNMCERQVRAHERRLHVKIKVGRAPTTVERLGLTDPWTVAWELMPLSFVADWILPIGNFLKSLHAVGNLPVYSCVITEVFRRHVRMRAKPGLVFMQSHLGWYWSCLEGGEYVYDHTNMDRSVSYTLPSPFELLTQIPQQIRPKWDLDLRNLVDSAALTHQALYRMNSHAAKF